MQRTHLLPYLLCLTFTLAACSQAPAPVINNFEGGQRSAASPSLSQPYVPQKMQSLFHTVQRGETLWDIAQRYNTTTAELIALNSLSSSILYVGQKLKVYENNENTNFNEETVPNDQKLTFTQRISQPHKQETVVDEQREKPVFSQISAPEYTHHRVRAGENLFRIGLRYGVSPLDLMAENDLKKPEDLQAGSVIKVPLIQAEKNTPAQQEERKINENLARSKGFVWPAKGKILHKFGKQEDGIINNGIKIELAENAPIHAAEAGVVIYADNGLKTYGNLILLRHENGLITAYAHNSQNLVNRHDKVQKGEVIAFAGMTGSANTPQLHFEVRRNARAIDPLKVLP